MPLPRSNVIEIADARTARAARRAEALSWHQAMPCPACGTHVAADEIVAGHARYVCRAASHAPQDWLHDGGGNVFHEGRARRFFRH